MRTRKIGVLVGEPYGFTAVHPMVMGMRHAAAAAGHVLQYVPRYQNVLRHLSRMDGAIAVSLGEEDIGLLARIDRAGVPLVHMGELDMPRPIHEVRCANSHVGRIGAEHLLERGLRHFAFVGAGSHICRRRQEGFLSRLSEAGFKKDVAVIHSINGNESEPPSVFLKRLPWPVGIMASCDRVGALLAGEASLARISIPERVALLGVDNSEFFCTLAMPPLSSITAPGHEMGRHAVRVLEDLISGRPTPMAIDINSARVIERQSTAVIHSDNADIAAAISLIRQRNGIGIGVRDVADAVGVSVSTLERGIKAVLGRKPLEEILRLRRETAKKLLAETDMPIKLIAARCGYRAPKRLVEAIQADEGLSPRAYRARVRSFTTRME